MTSPFEETRRWEGAPLICTKANLPAFDSKEEAKQYHRDTNPRGLAYEPWLCAFCGKWHYKSVAADPSGSTSGTTRNARHYGSRE